MKQPVSSSVYAEQAADHPQHSHSGQATRDPTVTCSANSRVRLTFAVTIAPSAAPSMNFAGSPSASTSAECGYPAHARAALYRVPSRPHRLSPMRQHRPQTRSRQESASHRLSSSRRRKSSRDPERWPRGPRPGSASPHTSNIESPCSPFTPSLVMSGTRRRSSATPDGGKSRRLSTQAGAAEILRPLLA